MNKQKFLADASVTDFINWLSDNFSAIDINLIIKNSPYVPQGINKKITGIQNVLPYYRWKSKGMQTGDWAETKARLAELGKALRDAVVTGDDPAVFASCLAISEWGGDRNSNRGAIPFLEAKFQDRSLCQYILKAGTSLELAHTNETDLASTIKYMNAMLTKVHALYANDGLPIYDSRVAAAIACLVELWRINNQFANLPLPYSLSFPATDNNRKVRAAFPNAQFVPYIIRYNRKYQERNAARWSSAKVRLGWLMQEILRRHEGLFLNESNRMHALEACLFMLGSNVACLNNNQR